MDKDKGGKKMSKVGKIEKAYLIYIQGNSLVQKRPVADEVYVIHWEDAGVIIPWHEGVTIKEAILEWAKFMERVAH